MQGQCIGGDVYFVYDGDVVMDYGCVVDGVVFVDFCVVGDVGVGGNGGMGVDVVVVGDLDLVVEFDVFFDYGIG